MQLYRAFLLRCWSTQTEEALGPWRFSLEEVGPERQRMGFASLEALMAYISSELNDAKQCCSSQGYDPPPEG